MEIDKVQIPIKDLIDGYKDMGDDGVVGYKGLLNIRPAFQREFVYNPKQRDEVIKTVSKGFPLNTIYWTEKGGKYELLDGQQRTISICQYVDNQFSMKIFDKEFARPFHSLSETEKNAILDYKLDVYICNGTDKEKLDWFEIINIAGEKLTDQERRNAIFTGPWLSLAKAHFSKTNCPIYLMYRDYLNGSAIRQEYLEISLNWIAHRGHITIDDYMAGHQNDTDIDDIQQYIDNVFTWVKSKFKTYYKEMKGLPWGIFYNKYKDTFTMSSTDIDIKIKDLMEDSDVTKKSGIYEYLLSGNEKYLNIRAFDENTKRSVYTAQGGKCAKCGKDFKITEMEADHITPWSQGGKTEKDNCQMLCKECNRRKSDS